MLCEPLAALGFTIQIGEKRANSLLDMCLCVCAYVCVCVRARAYMHVSVCLCRPYKKIKTQERVQFVYVYILQEKKICVYLSERGGNRKIPLR